MSGTICPICNEHNCEMHRPMTDDRPAAAPRTQAGRDLLAQYDDAEAPIYPVSVEAILAIEAEAARPTPEPAPAPDTRERADNLRTAIEKGVIRPTISDLAHVGGDDIPERAAPADPLSVEALVTVLHDVIPHWEGHKPMTAAHRTIHEAHAREMLARLRASSRGAPTP